MTKKIFTILTLLFITLTTVQCFGKSQGLAGSSYFEAVSDSNNIYYVIKDFKEDKWDFSVFFADSTEPQLPLKLNKYPDSPRFFIAHDGKAVAFFPNGTCLGYSSNGTKTTFQSLPKNFMPLHAISVKNNIYLLAEDNNKFCIFMLDNNQWVIYSSLPGNLSEKFLNPKLFYYDNFVYLAGITPAGTLICDAVNGNDIQGLDLILDDNRRFIDIDAVINVNRTTVFVLKADSYKSKFVAVKFINNNFTDKFEISTSPLPEIGSRKYSFLSYNTDLMLAVYSDKNIHLQKYDLNGTIIGQPLVSYSINTNDSFNNIFFIILGYLSTAIIAAVIIINFKKAVSGGSVPATAQGKPCPITLRLPAFIIDMICISFVLDIIVYILDIANVINIEQLEQLKLQMQNQINTAGAYINTSQLLILLAISLIAILIYFTLFEWLLSFTPGKALFGLKVADYHTLSPIKEKAFTRILIRNILRIIELFSFLALVTLPLVIFIMILSPRKQRPGDMLSNTTVVLTRSFKKKTGQNVDHQA